MLVAIFILLFAANLMLAVIAWQIGQLNESVKAGLTASARRVLEAQNK